MTRTTSAQMDTMLARKGADAQTRARCIYLALRDGTSIGITDHDQDLVIDLDFISDVPITFRADTGVMPSDISLSVGLNADNMEISGPLTDLITRAAVLGKRFNRATVKVFDIDWERQTDSSANDILKLLAGNIADARIQGGSFVFEVRSYTDRFNQTIGRLLTPYCDADFGDARCGKNREDIAAEVTAVTDDFRFTLDLAGTYANDYFNLGTLEFLTGELAGTEEVEVFDYVGASSAVTILAPLPQAPAIGDTLVIRRGCSKLKKSDDATLPTCHSYDNVINFRGFDRVPGSDQYLKVAVPGQGN